MRRDENPNATITDLFSVLDFRERPHEDFRPSVKKSHVNVTLAATPISGKVRESISKLSCPFSKLKFNSPVTT